MSRFEIKMPKLGESITEGTIISWSVKVGDTVQEDDVLFEVNTCLLYTSGQADMKFVCYFLIDKSFGDKYQYFYFPDKMCIRDRH